MRHVPLFTSGGLGLGLVILVLVLILVLRMWSCLRHWFLFNYLFQTLLWVRPGPQYPKREIWGIAEVVFFARRMPFLLHNQ